MDQFLIGQTENSPTQLAIMAVIGVIAIIGMCRVYTKAGQPAIAAIIPIWNIFVLLEIAGKPGVWFILLLIPIVNIIFFIRLINAVSLSFGKGTGFTIGLIFLGPIFWLILGLGSAQYVGPPTSAAPAS